MHFKLSKINRKLVLSILLLFFSFNLFPQTPVYELDLSNLKEPVVNTENLKEFTEKSPDGTTLGVNNRYFTKNGKSWLPVMGKFHYIRYPRKYWEEEILKMKAADLSIIATYIFWNAHEKEKGKWSWTGNSDLRYFVELCQKHGMYVWLRIGPWSHGEQLYGGFPEWINKMRKKRTDNKLELRQLNKTGFLFKSIPGFKNCKHEKSLIYKSKNGIFSKYSLYVDEKEPKFEITFPKKSKSTVNIYPELPENVCDIFLEIKYYGDMITAYNNGKILTDNFFNGLPWMFGVKRYLKENTAEINFIVSPWRNKITGVAKEFEEKAKEGPVITDLKVHPQYRIVLDVN